MPIQYAISLCIKKYPGLILVLIVSLFSGYAAAQDKTPKETILVIHSWHDILWDRLWGKALDDRLGNDYHLVHISLDAMRSAPLQLQENADDAWHRYRALNPSLVILGDDEALRVMGKRFVDKLPVVYLGINNNPRKLVADILPRNFTGIMERPLYERTLRQIINILPEEADRVLFMNDAEQDRSSVTNISHIFNGNTFTVVGNVKVELVVTNQWEEWKRAVKEAGAKGYDAIIFDSRYLIFAEDGTYVEPEPGVLHWMAENSELPLFNFYDDAIGPRLAAGGWVLSGYGIGSAAADIVIQILKEGKHPKDIYPVYYSKGEYIFSRTQLKHWGVKLPVEIEKEAVFAEDLYQLYHFDCKKYPRSICID